MMQTMPDRRTFAMMLILVIICTHYTRVDTASDLKLTSSVSVGDIIMKIRHYRDRVPP